MNSSRTKPYRSQQHDAIAEFEKCYPGLFDDLIANDRELELLLKNVAHAPSPRQRQQQETDSRSSSSINSNAEESHQFRLDDAFSGHRSAQPQNTRIPPAANSLLQHNSNMMKEYLSQPLSNMLQQSSQKKLRELQDNVRRLAQRKSRVTESQMQLQQMEDLVQQRKLNLENQLMSKYSFLKSELDRLYSEAKMQLTDSLESTLEPLHQKKQTLQQVSKSLDQSIAQLKTLEEAVAGRCTTIIQPESVAVVRHNVARLLQNDSNDTLADLNLESYSISLQDSPFLRLRIRQIENREQGTDAKATKGSSSQKPSPASAKQKTSQGESPVQASPLTTVLLENVEATHAKSDEWRSLLQELGQLHERSGSITRAASKNKGSRGKPQQQTCT